VECWNGSTPAGTPYLRTDNFSLEKNAIDEEILILYCLEDYFEIKCKADTYQKVKDKRFCTTQDGKSVRVKLIDK